MSAAADSAPRPVRQLPEPARLWIAFAPRRWRAVDRSWSDFARGHLRPANRPPLQAPSLAVDEQIDDLIYLPPVAPDFAAARDRLAGELAAAGSPLLVQLWPGERCVVPGALAVYDLLPCLLEDELAPLSTLPAGGRAVWPLLGGITDREELWREGCARLRDAGVETVQGIALEIAPVARSRLAADRSSRVFDALFHHQPPSERLFARLAHEHGLAPFLPRPESGHPLSKRRNRRLAAALFLAGELWLRLDRSLTEGHALLRAARGVEESEHDLTAVLREGNLEVLGWLDAAGRRVIEEVTAGGESSLVRELLEAYVEREAG